MRGAIALAAALAGLACAEPDPGYRHSRFDYWAFRARVGMLPEPNYLPWLMHSERLPQGGLGLVACRWRDDEFPLRYFVASPQIPTELQDEFNPRDPAEYVEAVVAAFAAWEQAIGRPVRFQRAESRAEAALVVHLRAAAYVEEDARVLGRVPRVRERCRVKGAEPTLEQVAIDYAAPEAELFVIDAHGLLTPRQVQAVALHEIGHLLGASGQHSPLRGDVMYAVADDSRVDAISEHDRNSFRALYRLEPGAVYARPREPHAEPLPEVRRGPPRLAQREVDERFGVGVRFPVGWQVMRSRRGWVAVDGVTWDYDASVQVLALRGQLDAFVEQQRRSLAQRDSLEAAETLQLDGQPVVRLVARGEGYSEETVVQPWGEGWLLLMVADCATRDYSLYRPWFERILLSIEHVGQGAPQP